MTISSASPCSRAARAIEPPISPKPISAIGLNGGVALICRPRSRASLRRPADWLPRCRWSCEARAAGRSCRAQRSTSPRLVRKASASPAVLPLVSGNRSAQNSRRSASPWAELADLSVSQFRHCSCAPSTSGHARYPRSPHRGQHRRRRDVEGSTDPIDRIDDVGRPEHPAKTQRSEPVNLGEGVGHHHIFSGRDQFDPGVRSRCATLFRIGGVSTSTHARQTRPQALDLVEREIRSGRIVRVGEPHQLRAWRHQFRGWHRRWRSGWPWAR